MGHCGSVKGRTGGGEMREVGTYLTVYLEKCYKYYSSYCPKQDAV